MFVGYDPSTHQDKFYGGGPEVRVPPLGGNYVYDVSDPSSPVLLASVMGFPGQHGTPLRADARRTVRPDPGALLGGEYQPLRVFDLKPALDGEVKNVNRPIGAWIANWEHKAHNMEVRWPYVFVSNYEDGLQVFNMMDPTNLYTVGYYDTFDGPHGSRSPGRSTGGAWGADGLDAFEGSGDLALLRENLVEFFLCAGHRLAASSEEPVPRHPRVVAAANRGRPAALFLMCMGP